MTDAEYEEWLEEEELAYEEWEAEEWAEEEAWLAEEEAEEADMDEEFLDSPASDYLGATCIWFDPNLFKFEIAYARKKADKIEYDLDIIGDVGMWN